MRIIKGRGGPGTSQGGTLEIRTGGTYAPLIQHQSATLIERINLFLGAGSIARLRIIQGPLTLQPRTPPPPRPKPLTATEELELQQSLTGVDNDKIKNALLKLGRAVIQKSRKSTP